MTTPPEPLVLGYDAETSEPLALHAIFPTSLASPLLTVCGQADDLRRVERDLVATTHRAGLPQVVIETGDLGGAHEMAAACEAPVSRLADLLADDAPLDPMRVMDHDVDGIMSREWARLLMSFSPLSTHNHVTHKLFQKAISTTSANGARCTSEAVTEAIHQHLGFTLMHWATIQKWAGESPYLRAMIGTSPETSPWAPETSSAILHLDPPTGWSSAQWRRNRERLIWSTFVWMALVESIVSIGPHHGIVHYTETPISGDDVKFGLELAARAAKALGTGSVIAYSDNPALLPGASRSLVLFQPNTYLAHTAFAAAGIEPTAEQIASIIRPSRAHMGYYRDEFDVVRPITIPSLEGAA